MQSECAKRACEACREACTLACRGAAGRIARACAKVGTTTPPSARTRLAPPVPFAHSPDTNSDGHQRRCTLTLHQHRHNRARSPLAHSACTTATWCTLTADQQRHLHTHFPLSAESFAHSPPAPASHQQSSAHLPPRTLPALCTLTPSHIHFSLAPISHSSPCTLTSLHHHPLHTHSPPSEPFAHSPLHTQPLHTHFSPPSPFAYSLPTI